MPRPSSGSRDPMTCQVRQAQVILRLLIARTCRYPIPAHRIRIVHRHPHAFESNGAVGASVQASGLPAAPITLFSLDTGVRPVSNACPGEPGAAPDDEVNTHLG